MTKSDAPHLLKLLYEIEAVQHSGKAAMAHAQIGELISVLQQGRPWPLTLMLPHLDPYGRTQPPNEAGPDEGPSAA